MFEMSQFSLKGKTAIVTGGGRGLGRAIAIGFAKAGAKVVLTSRKIDDLEATAKDIRSFGGVAFPVQSHLGKMEEIQKMVETAMEKLGGRIDILVNNAGASPATSSVLESDERLWETIMNVNVKGFYFISQAVAKIMQKQGGGKIINVASIDGVKPEPGVSIYSISKAAVRMLTTAFAAELIKSNIQVNTILPGPFETKMMNSHWFHLPPEEAQKQKDLLSSKLPMGRIGDPDELAGAAIFLASSASSYTTGAEIIVDGGSLIVNAYIN
ncbi:MAG: glucose 1-dehydrogenase [Dehalococcoidia bacterium]|nr:glucose 1-dehydrogenase [Dehalococcoidia bacterium]